MERTAHILRIEHISITDGEGMRTVVFFKGCPLRCAWCSTPESHRMEPEVYYKKECCRFCGSCLVCCPQGALRFAEDRQGVIRDREKCTNCGACVEACAYHAMKVYGKRMTVSQVMREIEKDSMFHFFSGGGVTLSGGDLMLQADFARELLLACKDICMNTAAELDLYGAWENVEKVIPLLDSFYVDLKLMDSGRHQQWTGVGNESILANLRRAAEICAPGAIHIRTPVVWHITDAPENLLAVAEFCRELPNCVELEFLPYHRLGLHAYQQLGMEYSLVALPRMSYSEAWDKIAEVRNRHWPFRLKLAGEVLAEPGSQTC